METDHRLKDRRGAGCWSASVEACREVVCVCLYLSTRGRQHTEDHCAMVVLCLHVCVSLLEPDGVTLLILLVCWASEVDEPDRSVGPALCVCERLSGGTVVALSLCWLHLSHYFFIFSLSVTFLLFNRFSAELPDNYTITRTN